MHQTGPCTLFRLQVMEDLADELLVELRRLAAEKLRVHLRLHGVDGGVALLLDGDAVGLGQLVLGLRLDEVDQFGVNRRGLPVPARLAGLLDQLAEFRPLAFQDVAELLG